MDAEIFIKKLHEELCESVFSCDDGAYTPCDILNVVLNSVSVAMNEAKKGEGDDSI